jgi:hypothetical protein
MFRSVGALFGRRKFVLDEADLKGLVERYLREELSTHNLYCERVKEGDVWVRVGEVFLQQEVYLMKAGLKERLSSEADYKLKRLKVRVGQ